MAIKQFLIILAATLPAFVVEGKPSYDAFWDSTYSSSAHLVSAWALDTLYDKVGTSQLSYYNSSNITWLHDSGLYKKSNSALDLPSAINLKGRYTISWRGRCDSVTTSGISVVMGQRSNVKDFIMLGYAAGGGTSYVRVRNDYSTGGQDLDINMSGVNVGQWHTYSVVSISADSTAVYVDGVWSGGGGDNVTWTDSIKLLSIGMGYNSPTTYNYRGWLDWVMYHNDTLSPSEIDTLHSYPFGDFRDPAIKIRIPMHGQSNMAGRGEAPYYGTGNKSQYWFNGRMCRFVADPMADNEVGATGSIGPSLSNKLKDLRPDVMFQWHNAAIGGNGFATGTTARWADTTSSMYNFAVASMDTIRQIHNDTPLVELFWGGESDVNLDSSVILDSITKYLRCVRRDLKSPYLRILFIRPYWGGNANNTRLRNAFNVAVNADRNNGSFIIGDAADFSAYRLSDSVHYTGAGYDTVGKFVARILDENGLYVIPIIDSVYPDTVSYGDTCNISGKNFLKDTALSVVNIGEIISKNDTSIIFIFKGVSGGLKDVIVTNPFGFKDTATSAVYSIVTIDSVRPNPYYSGRVVSFYGSFSSSQGSQYISVAGLNMSTASYWSVSVVNDTIPIYAPHGKWPVYLIDGTDTLTCVETFQVVVPSQTVGRRLRRDQ